MQTWLPEIESWFTDAANKRRLSTVLGYTGCRELWLQAELATWLVEERGCLDAAPDEDEPGYWDTNFRIKQHGRFDLAVKGANQTFELALEIKVLGGHYQRKVLTGGAKTFATLKKRGWTVRPTDVPDGKFSLLADYQRLRRLSSAKERILLLVVDNRSYDDDFDLDLADALRNIDFKSQARRTRELGDDIYARLWHL